MSSKPVILCVDDLIENLRIRMLLLELFGCTTIAVTDHRAALRAISDQKVDLLLIDYHLADGETGEEIARDVRVIRPDLPMIMLTGDSKLPDSARECVDAVLIKGASDPKILIETIQKLLPGAKIGPSRENWLGNRNSQVS